LASEEEEVGDAGRIEVAEAEEEEEGNVVGIDNDDKLEELELALGVVNIVVGLLLFKLLIKKLLLLFNLLLVLEALPTGELGTDCGGATTGLHKLGS